MKKAPQRSASAHQRRGSGVFSTSPPLRGADLSAGSYVLLGVVFEVCSLRHRQRPKGNGCRCRLTPCSPAHHPRSDVNVAAPRLSAAGRLSIHRRDAGHAMGSGAASAAINGASEQAGETCRRQRREPGSATSAIEVNALTRVPRSSRRDHPDRSQGGRDAQRVEDRHRRIERGKPKHPSTRRRLPWP
jgi:hypothetical protein